MKFIKTADSVFMKEFCRITGFTYYSNGSFNIEDIKKHKIFPRKPGVPYKGLSGAYKNISFSVQEFLLATKDSETPGKSNKLHEWLQTYLGITSYNGKSGDSDELNRWIYVRLKLGRRFEGHTIIAPEPRVRLPFKTNLEGTERVNIVSSAFEKLFDVYSTSQVEARQILDPAFIERFMLAVKATRPSLKDRLNQGDGLIETLLAKRMEVSFLEDEILFIYQSPKKLLETSFALFIDQYSIYSGLSELDRVFRMIEALQFNPYTGLGKSNI